MSRDEIGRMIEGSTGIVYQPDAALRIPSPYGFRYWVAKKKRISKDLLEHAFIETNWSVNRRKGTETSSTPPPPTKNKAFLS